MGRLGCRLFGALLLRFGECGFWFRWWFGEFDCMGCYDAVCCLSAFCVGWYNIVSCGAGGVLLVFLLWVDWCGLW